MERDRIFAVSLLKQMIYLASILGISTISIPAGYLKKKNEKYWDLFHGLIWVVDQIKDYAEEKAFLFVSKIHGTRCLTLPLTFYILKKRFHATVWACVLTLVIQLLLDFPNIGLMCLTHI